MANEFVARNGILALNNSVITGSLDIAGNLTTTGTITAQKLNVQQVTSSVLYSSGSNVFGNSLSNTQSLTGSVEITGSLTVNNVSANLSNYITLDSAQTITGAKTFTNGIILGNTGVDAYTIKADGLTRSKFEFGAKNFVFDASSIPALATLTYTMPSSTGTLALTSQINDGTVTSVGGTGTVSGLTLSGNVTTSGNLTLGGTLSLTSGQVTTALGYTPYNSTNPNGYITGVSWPNISSGIRENYDLQFRPSDNSSSYAGFTFASPGSSGDAGYLLIRGGADSDVYTQNGITIVADLGWLTLAQRTTASKGVRIMTGTSPSVRAEFTTAGNINFIGATTFSSSVTATAYFESSSVTGKNIITTNPTTQLNLDVIKYTRKSDENKDIRYGYSAEQVHALMPELTDKDISSVKYLDVHTVLIAQLQAEIKALKLKLNS